MSNNVFVLLIVQFGELLRIAITYDKCVSSYFAFSISFASLPFTSPKIRLGSLNSAVRGRRLSVGRR